MTDQPISVHLTPSPRKENRLGSGVDLVVYRMHQMLPQNGVRLVKKSAQYDVLASHIFPSSLQNESIDVLHSHGLYPTAYEGSMPWMWEANRRIIEAARIARVITVPSPWVAEAFSREMGVLPAVVPHGIDMSEWKERTDFSDRPRVLWNKNRVVGVCSPEPLMALAEMAKKISFLTTFGEKKRNVAITGSMSYPKMKETLYAANIYFAPTKETFGIGVLEAMAAGMPVLCWRWGHTPYLVTHGVDGYIADPYDMEDTYKGLLFIIQNRAPMAIAARKKAEKYSWEAAMDKYVAVYRGSKQRAVAEQRGLITVVIPCYNYGRYIGEAVQSVKDQTHKNFECIIVDDGSTDDSLDLIRQATAGDDRFKIIHKANSGVADTRNVGALSGKGQFIVFLDADDRMLSNCLKDLIGPLMGDRSLGLVYGRLAVINDQGQVTQEVSKWPAEYSLEKQLNKQNQVPSCCMLRRDAFLKTGGFRQHTAPTEDAELWSRIPLIGYRCALVTQNVTYEYRFHQESESSKVRGGTEPNWLGWIPSTHGGKKPMASLEKPENRSHPIVDYDEPWISVIIPVGNDHRSILKDAIESVAGQTDNRWELIVVDDTTDGTLMMAGSVPYIRAYPWIRWVRNKKIGNVSAARNAGVAVARGHYLVYLDADDYFLPEFLKETLAKTQECNTDAQLVYTDWVSLPNNEPHKAEEWDVARLRDHALFAVTFVHAKSAFEEIGGFDEDLDLWEDWDYCIKLAMKGYFGVRVPTPLFAYRYDTGKRREDSLDKKEALLSHIRGKYAGAVPMPRRG